jgi:ABC-type multidrug transport system fused ATPase/permease subunit
MKTNELIKNFISKEKKTIILYLIVCILYYPLQSLTFTIVTGRLFDKFSNIQKNKSIIYKLSILICVLYVITNLAIFIKETIESRLIPEFNRELRTMIFNNIIDKMRIKYKDIDIGEFISRIAMISVKWDEVIEHFASIILPRGLGILLILGILFYFGPYFGMLTLVYIICIAILLAPRYKKCLNKLIDLRFALNTRNNNIQDKISNLFEIYIANKEDEEKRNNFNSENKYSKKYTDVHNCSKINSTLISLINIVYLSIMIYLVIKYLYAKKIDKPTAISIILLLVYIVQCVFSVFRTLISTSYSYSILKESEEFLNYISDFELNTNSKNVNAHSTIDVRNVSFKYNQDIVLQNVNLKINKNDKIIIKGVSGSGKSTLIKLICGFYTPSEGGIFIDKINTKEINIENLRSQITMLNQNVKLFNTSIYDNVRYINNNIIDENIDKFIDDNRINLFNNVNLKQNAGPNGNKLSGGQKQMTLIIRCLFANKNVLILDEPTSALDNYHFDILNKILQNTNKTIIVITHDSRFDKSKFTNRYHLKKGQLTKVE